MNPPSPWIGSMTMAATWSAPSSLSILLVTAASASGPQFSGPVGQRNG